jgi:hypothetical protein
MTRSHFVPCPSCSRHIRASEGSCPFCSASITATSVAPPAPSSRLSRAALIAFGAGTLVLAPACSSSGGIEECAPSNCAPPYGAMPPFEDSGAPEDGSLVLADAQVGMPDATDGGAATTDSGGDGGGEASIDGGDEGGGDAGADAGVNDAATDGDAGP